MCEDSGSRAISHSRPPTIFWHLTLPKNNQARQDMHIISQWEAGVTQLKKLAEQDNKSNAGEKRLQNLLHGIPSFVGRPDNPGGASTPAVHVLWWDSPTKLVAASYHILGIWNCVYRFF